MANVKITELTALTNPASSDVLPIVDVGADETKKVTIADLLENAGSGNASAAAFAFDGDPDTGMYRTGANALGFTTGGTGSLFINSSGNVGIGAASPVVACDVVGQVRASTGILFGSDTAAANALDDYEEGSWDGNIIGSTVPGFIDWTNGNNSRKCTYTKIGRVVYFHGSIRFDSAVGNGSPGSGDMLITGLPFATIFDGRRIPVYFGEQAAISYTAGYRLYGTIEGGQTQIKVRQSSNTGAVTGVPMIPNSTASSNRFICFSGFYMTY